MRREESEGQGPKLDWAATCRGACSELFAGIGLNSLARLEEALLPIRYREGELIFQAGAYAAGIYIVAQGLVQCGRWVGGRRHIVRLSGPG
ncbi:MAG: hypothetical protein ACE5KR_02180, partial [Candidatus Bipolaricaulia bacterium]